MKALKSAFACRSGAGVLLAMVLSACGTEGPNPPEKPGGGTTVEGECVTPPRYVENLAQCGPLPTDYQPRVNASVDDAWPACISDENVYRRINETVSTIARVAAFEEMGKVLWASGKVPTPEDFLNARVAYAQDQGLDSRVQRREDVNYPAPADGARCSTAGIPEQYPDRCVGPAKLLPVLNDAFQKGANGESPRVQAARIEAALLWFMYVSVLSEVTSCTDRAQDCDSAWAYYNGGTPREAPLGLAKYVAALGAETHERVYDGVLAVRCWRDLDRAVPATNLELRNRARDQVNRALLRGMALVVRQRFAELTCTTGEARAAREAFLQVILPLLDRAARERDAAQADVLKAQLPKLGTEQVDVLGAQAVLDSLFSCP